MTFNDFNLKKELLLSIEELGFKQPTPIQEKTIPEILNSNNDIIGLAQTGTGKTAAFGLPILQKIDSDNSKTQTLILSPTRELGAQIAKDLSTYSKFLPQIKTTALYGGANMQSQIKAIKNGSHIIVGTPGRTLDFLKRKIINLQNIDYLVLDEADEMLNMGFKEELDAILSKTPAEKQTFLFSATMPAPIRQIAEKYMNNPIEITIGKKNIGAENVSHVYYAVHVRNKYLALKRIVDLHPNVYGIVFCRTRSETKTIADKLMQDGYNADALHGDLSQAQREFVMTRFRNKHLQILVATDVAARGLDVDNLTHVINYTLPDDNEAYIHRSGRTGRAGKKGMSVSILNSREHNRIKVLERLVNKQFEYQKLPDGEEICKKQLFNLIDKMENTTINQEQIEPFMDTIYKKLEWLSREELIKHFVAVEFNKFLDYYKNSEDINVEIRKNKLKDRPEKKEREREHFKSGSAGFTRFFISIGIKDGLTPPKMIGLINDSCCRRDIPIGKIDLMRNFSFFEVDSKFESLILSSFKKAKFNNASLKVEVSNAAPAKKPDKNKRKPKSNKY